MMKLLVLYTPPAQVEEFDEHYTSVHVPLVHAMPGLLRFESAVAVGSPDGSPAPYHRVAGLYFEDADAMKASFASDAGKQTARDAAELAARTGSTVSMLVTVVD